MGGNQNLVQGTLSLMILKTLEALGPLHGFGVARRIEQTGGVRLTAELQSHLDLTSTRTSARE